jgi:Domain of unknown function (DUF4124)
MRTIVNLSVALVSLLVFYGSVSSAQSIYQWKDEKGQWHFTDFPPVSGAKVTKVFEETPSTESSPVDPEVQPGISSASGSESERKSDSKLQPHSSGVSHVGWDAQWLLIFPPLKPVQKDDTKRFSGWTPDKIFESDEACNRYKALLINDQFAPVNYRLLSSECIPAFEYITGREADLIIAATLFEPVATGFSSHFVSGMVFNRGLTTATHVITKYQVRDRNGVTVAQGEVSTTPGEIPGLTFAEFRTPSIGSWTLDGLSVDAEAIGSKR